MTDAHSNPVSVPLEQKDYVLSVDEMSLVLNMITVVAKRGAFQPGEFKLVGEFFDKYAPKPPSPEDKKQDESDN